MEPLVDLLGETFDNALKSKAMTVLKERPQPRQDEGRYYCSSRTDGISLITDPDSTIIEIHLFADGYQGFGGYRGALPHGLAFNLSRVQVRERLGPPQSFGGSKVIAGLGRRPAWDRYELSTHAVRVAYAEGEDAIVLVGIMMLAGS